MKFGETPFECKVPGKWVLTGEHSVLRGKAAVALPHADYELALKFQPAAGGSWETFPKEVRELSLDLFERLKDICGWKEFHLPSGRAEMVNTIPLGAGLGSSAALCVGFTRWVLGEKTPLSDIMAIATALENRFHGKSSGMDVAAVTYACPILFQNQAGKSHVEPLKLKQIPKFTFHDTGFRMKTSECVARVEHLRLTRPTQAAALDDQMHRASLLAREGLEDFSKSESLSATTSALSKISQAMELGQACFKEWGLLPEGAEQMEARLRAQGAQAVKLTGAGGGGFLVGVWV